MIQRFRNSGFSRTLWGFVTLILLNLSVDTIDPQTELIPEDLTINEQESVVEILLEEVLGIENAVAEYDDPDTDEASKKKGGKIDLVTLLSSRQLQNQSLDKPNQRHYDHFSSVSSGHHQLVSPPPES